MSKPRRQVSTHISNVAETKNLTDLKNKTGNLYESIAIIAKRANQINITMKEELHSKLEEFATHTDSLEEIQDRKSTRLNSSHVAISYAVFCLNPRPSRYTLFPYTTLFRSYTYFQCCRNKKSD